MKTLVLRELEKSDIKEAVKIQDQCWNEDFKGVVPTGCDEPSNKETFICSWLYEECEDIRKMYGIFDNDVLIGFIGGSIAEKEDMENAMELNYLFLRKEYRNFGLGLQLIKMIALDFYNKAFQKMIVYNWHDVESNKFYRGIGGKVLKQVVQRPGGKEALVDVFYWNMNDLLELLTNKIGKKKTKINILPKQTTFNGDEQIQPQASNLGDISNEKFSILWMKKLCDIKSQHRGEALVKSLCIKYSKLLKQVYENRRIK